MPSRRKRVKIIPEKLREYGRKEVVYININRAPPPDLRPIQITTDITQGPNFNEAIRVMA